MDSKFKENFLQLWNKSVIGMFDVSARLYVQENLLTFAVPFKRFIEMVSFMDDSFLITGSWQKVRRRINN